MSRRNGYSATWYILDIHDPDTLKGSKEFIQRKIGQRIGKTFLKTELVGILAFNRTGVFTVRELLPIDGDLLDLISQIEVYGQDGEAKDALAVAHSKFENHASIKPTWSKEVYLLMTAWPENADMCMHFVGQYSNIRTVMLLSTVDDEESLVMYTDKHSNLQIGLIETALEQVRAPNIRETYPVAAKNFLYIGAQNVDGRYEGGIQIAVRIMKATSKEALPSAKLVNKHSLGAKAIAGRRELVDVEGLDGQHLTAGGDLIRSRSFFVRPKEGSEEEEQKDVTEDDCKRVYRYGASLINIPTAEEGGMIFLALPQGLDVICCVPAQKFSREFLMGEIYYVHPEVANTRSQIEFSAIALALLKRGLYLVARYCRTPDTKQPALVVMRPIQGVNSSGDVVTIMQYCRVPYAEDYRKFHFNSLDSVTTTSGKVISSDHRLLTTDAQQEAMDAFVDACDCSWVNSEGTAIIPEDERDSNEVWYSPEQAYNPALHRLKEAIFHGVVTEDLSSNPVPPPHPAIVKYLEPCEYISDAQQRHMDRLIAELDIKIAPPRATRQSKTIEAQLAQEDKQINLAALGVGSDLHAEAKIPTVDAETEDEDDFTVSTVNPASELRLHFKSVGTDHVPEALWRACEDVVVELVQRSFSTQNYDKAIASLTVIRHATREKALPQVYQRIIDKVMPIKKDFEQRMTSEGLAET